MTYINHMLRTVPLTDTQTTTHHEDTFEYWVWQAAKFGRNPAECWQNCERICKEREKITK